MKRVHLFELSDRPWFPAAWRSILSDTLSFFAQAFNPFRPVMPILKTALEASGSTQIVDLCSGNGGTVMSIQKQLDEKWCYPVNLILTDKYPLPEAFERICRTNGINGDRVSYVSSSVDARSVPGEILGFRTLFASFHHFRPEDARAILGDAMYKKEGIAVFEYTERIPAWFFSLLLFPVFFLVLAPFILRPFSWKKFIGVYLPPIAVLAIAWDGMISCLRTYSPIELKLLVDDVSDGSYSWQIGRVHSFGACRVTYLVGIPKK